MQRAIKISEEAYQEVSSRAKRDGKTLSEVASAIITGYLSLDSKNIGYLEVKEKRKTTEMDSILSKHDIMVLNYSLGKMKEQAETSLEQKTPVSNEIERKTPISELERRFMAGEISREEWIRLDRKG
jgi:hypothetical protein